MLTKDRLAQELMLVKLPKMAEKAAKGYYDDFLSHLAFPITTLLSDLQKHSEKPPVLALIERVKDGEFDSSEAEANAWIESGDNGVVRSFQKRKKK